MAELKPCPYCGAIPIIQTKRLYKNKASTIIYRVIDENVDCRFFPSTGWYYLKQEAIENWNERADNARVRAIELKKTIEKACVDYGLNITIYDGNIAFVDRNERKIIAVWNAEYTMSDLDEQEGRQWLN